MPRQMLSEPAQNQEIGPVRSALDRATNCPTALSGNGKGSLSN